MDEISFKISGLAELERALKELPLKASKKIIREEVRAAVQPWAEEMRTRVRRGPHVWRRGHGLKKGHGLKVTAFIAQNIAIQIRVKSDLEAVAKVGPPSRGFWSIFLEFGTRHQPAYPFVRASFESRKQEVLDGFIYGIRRALDSVGLHLSK